MGTPKSQTDLMVGFYEHLLLSDMVRHYGDTSFEKDYRTLVNRVSKEGTSFLTKTLPVLAKAIDLALVVGSFTCPGNFKKHKGTAYPVFLSGLLKLVFNEDGSVKAEPSISAVRDLRQVCYLLYKYELASSQVRREEQVESFKSVSTHLGWSFEEFSQGSQLEGVLLSIVEVSRTLLRAVLRGVDFQNIHPQHGPGAVATGEKLWEKMEFSTKYQCIHSAYPYYKYFYANAMHLAENLKHYKELDSVPSGIAKLLFVPKDSRGERIISEEPLEFMWIQQGLKKVLYDHIERSPLTRGHVNFADQEINRNLALSGSVSGENVTLDMKEASDRVSLWLVRLLFADTELLRYLEATRTEATELPSGEIHLLRMFAPMGSALCFPIMSLVHWALAVSALHVKGLVNLRRAIKAVYVFGDDIVVKGENHLPLYDIFPKFGLRFNEGKSCTTGIFRESCGMDAVLGVPVTPVRFKKLFPVCRGDAEGYVSFCEHSSKLWDDGYYACADYVERNLADVFGKIPYVILDSDCPGVYSARSTGYPKAVKPNKYHSDWQAYGHHALKVKTISATAETTTVIQRRKAGITQPYVSGLHRRELHKKLCERAQDVIYPRPRWDFHRHLTTTAASSRRALVKVCDTSPAGIYTVPRRIKLKQGWTLSVIAWRRGVGPSGPISPG